MCCTPTASATRGSPSATTFTARRSSSLPRPRTHGSFPFSWYSIWPRCSPGSRPGGHRAPEQGVRTRQVPARGQNTRIPGGPGRHPGPSGHFRPVLSGRRGNPSPQARRDTPIRLGSARRTGTARTTPERGRRARRPRHHGHRANSRPVAAFCRHRRGQPAAPGRYRRLNNRAEPISAPAGSRLKVTTGAGQLAWQNQRRPSLLTPVATAVRSAFEVDAPTVGDAPGSSAGRQQRITSLVSVSYRRRRNREGSRYLRSKFTGLIGSALPGGGAWPLTPADRSGIIAA
jgi:hypothetical protein